MSAEFDEKIMGPEELRLDSPENKALGGNRLVKPHGFYGSTTDLNNVSSNTMEEDSSEASVADLVNQYHPGFKERLQELNGQLHEEEVGVCLRIQKELHRSPNLLQQAT